MADFSSFMQPSNPNRVAVVPAGVVSPRGCGLAETSAALREGRDCVTPVTSFEVVRCRCKTAGQVPDSRLGKARDLSLHPERLHRVAQMTILALQEALAQSDGFQPELTVMGTTSGGMTFGEAYYRALNAKASARHAASLVANYTPQKPVMD